MTHVRRGGRSGDATVKGRAFLAPGMTTSLPGGNDHPSWATAVGTLVSYGLILLFMFAALFVVPYLLFAAL